MKAEFLEETGSVDEVKAYLDDLVQKRCPELLEAMVFFVEFLLRHDDRDGAEELMERFSTEGRLWDAPRFRTHGCVDHGVDANAFIVVYMCNYYWKVRHDLTMARSLFTSNIDRCQKSLLFWKFYLNFEYSSAEKTADALLGLLNDCLASQLEYSDKLVMYDLYIHYSSTICTSVGVLTRLKADYDVWKLAARAEQATKEEERLSQKREAEEAKPAAVTPAVPTPVPTNAGGVMPAMMPNGGMMPNGAMPAGVPTDPNSPEYAQYYYQYYYQYYGMNYPGQMAQQPMQPQQ